MSFNRSHVVTIVLTLSGLLLSSQSDAAPKCQSLFADKTNQMKYGELKKDFKHSNLYLVEIGDQTKIKNQECLGTCHLSSMTAKLEQENEYGIKISTERSSAAHWRFQLLEVLDQKDNTIAAELGAFIYGTRGSLARDGIMPVEAWIGGKDFQSNEVAPKIEEYAKNITARTKWTASQEPNSKKREQIIEDGKNQIRAIFKDLVGDLDASFIYKGVTYNPVSFAQKFFPELYKPMVQLSVLANPRALSTRTDYSDYTFINTKIENIEASLRELVDKGISVYLEYNHNSQFVDNKTGIMSIAAFNVPQNGQPLTREQRNYFRDYSAGGHAVQIVGYDFDPATGQIIKWKIQNSWGNKSGDGGYYHMYADYFRNFAISISFYADAGIALPPSDIQIPTQRQLPF